jgi:PAS domain S-box-containing protein
MTISLARKVALTLAGSLALLALLAWLVHRTSRAFLLAADEFSRAEVAVADMRRVLALSQDLETGARGYVITGDSAFLKPYFAAQAGLAGRMDGLRTAFAGQPAALSALDTLSRLIAAKQDALTGTITARSTTGFEAAAARIRSGAGQRLMDEIRAQVASIESSTGPRIQGLHDLAQTERRQAVVMLTAAGILAVALAAGAGSQIARDFAAEQSRVSQLRDSARQLTGRVEDMSVALASRNEQLRAIVAAVPLAIVALDRTGRLTFWSPAAEAVFGWRAEEVLGGDLPIVPAERQGEYQAFRQEVLGGRAFVDRETQRLRRDGTLLNVSISTAPLRNAEGEIVGVAAAYVDLTARIRLEEQLRQSQKMEAVGRLAGGVAHDFNNILTAILGFAARVSHALPPDDPNQPDLREILTSAESAAGLIRQLLTFSRPHALLPQVVSVADVARSMEPMLRRVLGEQVDLRLRLSEDGRVRVDPHHLEQVLLNLCINAKDAMPDGGELVIETGTVDLQHPYVDQHANLAPGRYVMLAVRDTGTGMDKATQARIFEPFFTTKGPGVGTGLGLATVYGIVRQAGGSILVSSEPGRGSTFRVYLRATEEAVAPPVVSAPLAPLAPAAGQHILVVEDNPSVRALVTALLEDEGYRVTACVSGEEALRAAEQHEGGIDLLITDLILGQLSGLQLAQRLRSSRPGLPVVYMSGYAEDAIQAQALSTQEGATFLEKPFKAGVFLDRVAQVLHAMAKEPAV